MSDNATNVLQKAQDLNISPKFAPYMGVRILTGQQDDDGNDIVYESGDMTGRVLEISNEWGTQAQADNIAASISGWAYQPFDAGAALLDPAAELNDGITVNGVYSGICTKATAFGRLMATDVSAPQDEEINHEYAFVSATERIYTRQIKETKSELKIQASQIAAKVSSSGGKASSFGWVLTDSDWSLYSNGNLVLQADSSGLTVAGTIKAGLFQTLNGDTLATSTDLESIRTSAQGFTGGILAGGNFGDMQLQQYTASYILGDVATFRTCSVSQSAVSGQPETAGLQATSAAIGTLFVGGNEVSYRSKTPGVSTEQHTFRVHENGTYSDLTLTVVTGVGGILVVG